MGKMKTHKASSKVFKKTATGKLMYKKSGGNHITAKDSGNKIRKRRNQGTLSKGDSSRLKSVIK